MLINISGRTDIVNYYSDWMFKRFEEGYALSRNSLFPNSVRRYELTPEKVDCIIFGSKNFSPVLGRIHEITEKFPTYFHYTVTAYGKDVEPGVPDIDASMETFRYIAKGLEGQFDRCIFSFVEMYKKHEVNFPELIPLTEADKREIAAGIGKIAREQGFILQTCGPEADYAPYGILSSGCITLDILGRANGLRFRNLKHQGFRQGCHCMQSRDIGALNSCLNGCKYCYANKNAQLPRENYALHDPDSPLLIGHLKPTDRLEPGAQKSFLMKEDQRRA